MPADFKKSTIDGYKKLNEVYSESNILETYGNLTVQNKYNSGRRNSLLPQISLSELKKYIKYSKENGIKFTYTLNAPVLQNIEITKKGIYEIKEFLKKLYDIGVLEITASLPPLIEIIKSTNEKFKVKCSAIGGINTANKALSYKKLGVDKIVIDEGINRKFEILKDIIKAYGEEIELMVNVICYNGCVYRQFHYNSYCFESAVAYPEYKYYNIRCNQRMLNDPSIYIKNSWIRPEDIKHYYDIGIKYFKLQGRDMIMDANPCKAVEYYFKESFNGNLWELIMLFVSGNPSIVNIDNKKLDDFIKPFLQNKNFCTNSCNECHYCEGYVNKAIDRGNLDVFKNFINSDYIDKFSVEIKKRHKRPFYKKLFFKNLILNS
jgi:predicted nucleic-acid-binding Zn-ribbon protein